MQINLSYGNLFLLYKGIDAMIKNNTINNQDGLTLVELLGSIVILSIIVVSFLAFFIQSAKTTKVSEDIIDASYIAQQELEAIYHLSTDQGVDQLVSYLQAQGYTHLRSGETHEFSIHIDTYRVDVKLYPVYHDSGDVIEDLHTLLVKVFDSENRQSAQMETKFFFNEVEVDEG